MTLDKPLTATSRRRLLRGIAGGTFVAAMAGCGSPPARAGEFRVHFTEAQWKARLTPAQFAILRKEATERPYSSPLNGEKRQGLFACAGCNTPVYASSTKYDSGTGWPSFWDAIRGAVGTRRDFALGYPRTEVHCASCGGHLGHVFNDGPKPTGKRHCINGGALLFRPTAGKG